jgi:hypothetical protein
MSDTTGFGSALLAFIIIGVALALICVVTAAIPLCCGKLREYGKIIAACAILGGIVACFVPAIGPGAATGNYIDSQCAKCQQAGTPCDAAMKESLKQLLQLLGFIYVYMAYGWLAVLLGIVSAALGCCILCKCCKMKDADAGGVTGQPVATKIGS